MDAMENKQLTYHDYARMARLPLDQLAEQCSAQAFHASGPGGQCVNTTDSAVRMTHEPTGIVVVSRESRSQFRNRQLCLAKIREELGRRGRAPKVRHRTKPSRGQRQRRLDDKHRRSQVKQLRSRYHDE